MSDTLSGDEITELRQLLEIEKIRKLKLLYSQLMDSRDIDDLVEILWDDAVCEFGPYGTWTGKPEIHKGWKAVFDEIPPFTTLHVTTNQWVEMTGPDTAISRTYLIETTHEPDPRTNPIAYFGLYEEAFSKRGGEWKMSRCALQFLWPDRQLTDAGWPGPFPPKN